MYAYILHRTCFFLAGLMLFTNIEVSAQVSAGPLLGLNFANVKGGNRDTDNKFRIGISMGGFLKVAISDVIALQPEVIYSQKGYKKKTSFSTAILSKDTNITHQFSYIDFPFLTNITIGENGFMHIGPGIGYIINAKQKGSITITSNGNMTSHIIDTSDVFGFNTTEYTFSAGGGYKFNFGMTVSLRGTYGISKLYLWEGATSRNLLFRLTLAYSFGADSAGKGKGIVYKRL